MNARSPIRALAISALAIVVMAATVWSAGFFYWHISIKREIARVKDPTRWPKFQSGDVVGREVRSFGLPGAGSRAIPYLLDAIDEAAADRNLGLMITLTFDLSDTVARAGWKDEDFWEVDPSRRSVLLTHDMSVESLLKDQKANREWWMREQNNFPPRWMWWSGKRRTP